MELLRAPALLFAGASRLRGWLYDRRVLRIQSLDTPVVSVGNLTAGGTGKTPMVAWLVRAFLADGLRPGILSRGYGSSGAEGEPNDEARLLAREFPDVPHVQDRDRVAGGERLQALGVDVIVLDDGFQHRRLHRDLDVVLVDATRPWGLPSVAGREALRAFLPRGLLREGPAALRRADLVVITRADAADAEDLAGLRAEIGHAVILTAAHRPRGLRTLAGETRALADLDRACVDLVSGIGNPAAFEATVRTLGAQVGVHRALPDHHAFSASDLAGLEGTLVVTAKDAPKLQGLVEDPDRVLVLDITLELLGGEALLRERLAALPEGIRRRERRTLHEGLHG